VKKSPDRDGVDDESPDHLGDLDDGDEGCDGLDDAGRSLEGHEEKVHVHDGVHEVVSGREPEARGVLRSQCQPAEEHHGSVVVPLQKANLLALQDEKDRVHQLGNFAEAKEAQRQGSGTILEILHQLTSRAADRELQSPLLGHVVEALTHVIDAPGAEHGKEQVPSREASVHCQHVAVLSHGSSGSVDHDQVAHTEKSRNAPLLPAKTGDRSESGRARHIVLQGDKGRADARESLREVGDGRHLRSEASVGTLKTLR